MKHTQYSSQPSCDCGNSDQNYCPSLFGSWRNFIIICPGEIWMLFMLYCQSWSHVVGSQTTGDIVMNPALDCHYFLPGPQLSFQWQTVVTIRPVSSYTAWRQRHLCMCVWRTCSELLREIEITERWTCDFLIVSLLPLPYIASALYVCT